MAKDIKVEIVGDASKLKKSLNEAQGATSKFDQDVGKLGKTIAGVFGAAEAVQFGKDAVMAASNYNETVSKSEVIFGKAGDAAIKFAEGAAESFGLSQQAALDAEATFAIFGKGAGIAGEELVGFSQKLTGLAADMASFSNTSPEQAIQAIGAALRGESEPIRAYGVLLDDATLKARAMTLGIYDGTGSLTQQQRVLAAQAEILAQTSDAQGDFTRTSDGMAGQMKIATAELENMKVQLGQNLIPLVVDAAKNLIWLTKTMGPLIDKANSATEAIGGLGTVLDFFASGPLGAAKALLGMKDALTTFTPNVDKATAATADAVLEMVKYALETKSASEAAIDLNESLADDTGVHGLAALNRQMEFQSKAATDAAKAAGDLAEATRDAAQAAIDAIPHADDLEQATRDLESSYYDLQVQIEANAEAQKDSKLTDEAKAQAARDVASAVHDQAGQVFELAQQYAAEKGAAAGSLEQHQLMRDSLELSRQMYPELRDELNRYIAALNLAAAAAGNLGAATGVGGIAHGAPGFSVGGASFASGTARVPGSRGQPMLATVHGGEQIIPAGGNGGGGPTIVVNVSGVVGDKSAVIRWVHEGLKEAQRQQGLSGLG